MALRGRWLYLFLPGILFCAGIAAQQCEVAEIPYKYYRFDSVGAVSDKYKEMLSVDNTNWQVMYVLSRYQRAFGYYLAIDSSGSRKGKELTEKGDLALVKQESAAVIRDLYRILSDSVAGEKYYYLTCREDYSMHWYHVLVICNKALNCRIEIFAPSGQIANILYQQIPFSWGRELVNVLLKAFPDLRADLHFRVPEHK